MKFVFHIVLGVCYGWIDRICGNDFHWSGKGCELIQMLISTVNGMLLISHTADKGEKSKCMM
jgi:hypothetical protein